MIPIVEELAVELVGAVIIRATLGLVSGLMSAPGAAATWPCTPP